MGNAESIYHWGQIEEEAGGCTTWTGNQPLFAAKALSEMELPTWRAEQSQGLVLDEAVFEWIRKRKPNAWTLTLPLPGGGAQALELESFLAFKPDLVLGRTTVDGERAEAYVPGLLSYRITTPGVTGVVNIMRDHVLATFQTEGVQWELSPAIGDKLNGTHALFRTADNRLDLSFACATDELAEAQIQQLPSSPATSNFPTAACVEIGLDIDYSTFLTFASCSDAADWALAMLAGVSVVYESELGNAVTLSASYLHVWEVADPYASTINNAGTMLDLFRAEWNNNAPFNTYNWDLCHLLTKRTNTGTGGIAYVGVLCDPIYSAYGAGFSANLDNSSTYTAGTYAWNLNVVAHELGHNFGAHHTHWCGWTGGPIDNCYNLEGDALCDPYTDNPTPQVGTIMSYCHAIAGGSVTLNFHTLVENEAILPRIQNYNSCIGTCDNLVTSCGYYGCTDPSYCNYDAEAVTDDGSCADYDDCGVCAGDNTSCGGCTDPTACNYNPLAELDAGNCTYATGDLPCGCVHTAAFSATNLGPFSGSGVYHTMSGDLSEVFVSIDWSRATPPDPQSQASDLLLRIDAPSGGCAEIGGVSATYGCAQVSGMAWPTSWNSTAAGTYTATLDFSSLGLSGSGSWVLLIANGDANGGDVNADVTLTFAGICDSGSEGCTVPVACNYNTAATVDDGSCVFPEGCDTCSGQTDGTGTVVPGTDSDSDGICDSDEVIGCQDETGCNYDASATDSGTCTYPEAYYDCAGDCLNDADGDGTCDELEVVGCQDDSACNFDAAATDSGACNYPDTYYDCSGNCLNDLDGDGVCDELEVVGCQDADACNYEATATDTGDCTYAATYYDCAGNCLNDADSDGVCDELEVAGCQDNTACNYNSDATDAASCTYPETHYDCEGNCVNDLDGDGVCDELEVTGCQDEAACNFDASATDAGSCDYPGIHVDCNGDCLNDSDEDGVCDEFEVAA